MTLRDIIGIIVLCLAYLITWILFFHALKIVKIIDRENLRHLNQIRKHFNRNRK